VAEGSELADPVQMNQQVLALMQRTL
jgi:hypothetical protein